jgi:hypothetical protein
MPSYLFGSYLNNVVSVHFPGGRLGFAKAGCEVVIIQVPGEKDLAYILVPAETTKDLDLDAFRKAVEAHAEKKRVRVRWVSDSNVVTLDPNKVKLSLLPLMIVVGMVDPQASILCRNTVLVVGFHGTKEDAEGLLKVIEEAKAVRRVVIVLPVGSIEQQWDIPNEEAETEPEQVIEAAPNKGRAINASDIADIASLLEHSGDVNEFLTRI